MHEGYARYITIFTFVHSLDSAGRWNGDIEDPDIDSMQRQSAMGTQKLLQHLIDNVTPAAELESIYSVRNNNLVSLAIRARFPRQFCT